ncbi:extracellular solute-binding protein [Streptomyces fulvorobeus]|uniref:Arabinogalactan oligomer/maltooligosaccharide transport system substrate-binding protein n=1 Tax=Streptomyces fulvorobeus TaxID=284028 RepID=A0A7J0BZG6_9ACTN|nr:extracellular solute-binding protein [Streptomyces fulvorobeus]NYE39414.1 arabinogalactan oligomer/maltooligosaccharide transport system substrate-binding protein [Streptomyces fulvorobeus]GFM95642.1 sugar ABC transporter substrate-binding protein [Streptomyces fulvorobeus]
MRRGIAAAALISAISICASACSGGTSDSGDASGPVTITWWDTSDATNEGPTYKALVQAFEKANPDIEVTYVSVPFGDAQTKFQTAAGSKGAPDVLRADVGWTPGFAKAGYLAPLDDTAAGKDVAAFEPGLIEQGRYEGKLYGIPQVTDTLAMMYNKDLFTKAGITEPPATWTQWKSDIATVKDKTGVDGFAFNPQGYYAMPFLYGEGTDMVDPGAKKITLNSPAAIKGIDTLKDLVKAKGTRKLDTTSNAYPNIMDAFSSGKVASIIQGPWENANVFKGSAFADKNNLGIAPVPAGSTGRAGAPLGGHNLVAYAGSDAAHQEASSKFIAFMTSAQSQSQVALKNGTLPTRGDAYTAEVTANPGIAGYQKVLPSGQPRKALPEYSSLYTPLETQLIKILSGQESTEGGLDNAATEAKKLLSNYSVS